MKTQTTRVGLLHADSRFVEDLSAPMRDRGWEVSVLADVPSGGALAAMRLNMLLVDVGALVSAEWLTRELGSTPGVGFLACAEKSTVAQRVRGLEAGLDGWIDGFCHPQEVLARIQTIMHARAAHGVIARPPIHSGELHVRPDRFDAVGNGRDAGLTTREFELLELLARHEGAVLSREQIYSGVWGNEAPAGDRSVDIFVSRIRRKLRRVSPGWRYLHTHQRVGYRFASAEQENVTHYATEAERSAGGRGQGSQAERLALV
jgi:DNA-binding response OmpR family regulator